MRKRMIAGNWKMNKTFSEAIVLAQGIVDELSAGTGDVDVVVAPPAVDLKGVSEVLTQANSSVALSAQNVYWEESGAYTGETAPSMLESVGATHCIIGHSERRGYFGETDEDINRKAKALMAHGIIPISCSSSRLKPIRPVLRLRIPLSMWWPMSLFGPSVPERLPRLMTRKRCAAQSVRR